MVDVDVDDRNPIEATAAGCRGRHGGIVIEAEAHGAVGFRMMARGPDQGERGFSRRHRMLGCLNGSPSREPRDRFGVRRGERVRVEHDGPTACALDGIQVPAAVNALELLTDSRLRIVDPAAILQPSATLRRRTHGHAQPVLDVRVA